MFESNKKVFETPDIVKEYASSDRLDRPEEVVLNALKGELRNMKMLDIGVGGGRTTLYFAPLAKQYCGIDYSEAMIGACRKRFADLPEHISFLVCDARDMRIFEDNSFDFILFSFNGIDYMSHEERFRSFAEIKRVGRNGGVFLFSSHNLLSIDQLLKIRLSRNPLTFLRTALRGMRIRFLNEKFSGLKTKPYAILNDGARQGRLETYYIRPQEQVAQLYELGFKDVAVYALDGRGLAAAEDPWIHYLART